MKNKALTLSDEAELLISRFAYSRALFWEFGDKKRDSKELRETRDAFVGIRFLSSFADGEEICRQNIFALCDIFEEHYSSHKPSLIGLASRSRQVCAHLNELQSFFSKVSLLSSLAANEDRDQVEGSLASISSLLEQNNRIFSKCQDMELYKIKPVYEAFNEAKKLFLEKSEVEETELNLVRNFLDKCQDLSRESRPLELLFSFNGIVGDDEASELLENLSAFQIGLVRVKGVPRLPKADENLMRLLREFSQKNKLSEIGLINLDFSEASEKFAQIISSNRDISKLSLALTKLDQRACDGLSEFIRKNKKLSELDLSYVDIDDASIRNLWPAIVGSNIANLDLSTPKEWGVVIETLTEDLMRNASLLSIKGYPSSRKEDVDKMCARNLGFKDLLDSFSRSVVAPILFSDASYQFELDKAFLDGLSVVTRSILFRDVGLNKLSNFSHRWHQPDYQRSINRVRDLSGKSWEPIFGEENREIDASSASTKELNLSGWKVRVLTTPQELMKEGDDLEHCVGGYSFECILGSSHILSVVNSEGSPVSTMEILTNYNEERISVRQHFGKNNSNPSDGAELVSYWLINQIKNRSIAIDYNHLKNKREARSNNGSYEDKLLLFTGFDVRNSDKVNEVRMAYESTLINDSNLMANFNDLVSAKYFIRDGEIEYSGISIDQKTSGKNSGEKKKKLSKEEILGGIKEKVCQVLGVLSVNSEICDLGDKKKFGNIKLTFVAGSRHYLKDLRGIFGEDKIELDGDKNIIIKEQPMVVLNKLNGAPTKKITSIDDFDIAFPARNNKASEAFSDDIVVGTTLIRKDKNVEATQLKISEKSQKK